MYNDFQNFLTKLAAVNREKFGPGERRKGVIEHITQEFEEIESAETKLEAALEWVDVGILALDGLLRAVREMLREKMADAGEGPNVDQSGQICGFNGEPTNDYVAGVALTMFLTKQAKNELRDFGDWRAVSEDEPMQHKAGVHD